VPIKDHVKEKLESKEFTGEVVGSESFEQKELVRVFAVGVTFKGVSFKQALLSSCYFRNCRFVECDFTGAQFKESSLRGTTFSSCKFSYSTWEKTFIDDHFLDACLPSEENLARDLVRTLRVNFAQIGNYEAVNRAAALEVQLTGQHLYNAAYSNQSYYRHKYRGLDRFQHAAQHAWWKALDLLWGNGESLVRVLMTGGVAIVLAAVWLNSATPALTAVKSLERVFLGFWGVGAPTLPEEIAVVLALARYLFLGLFMAILVKRLSRR
jgi:uncharacterized protein YjbI with pentapeptide repeats